MNPALRKTSILISLLTLTMMAESQFSRYIVRLKHKGGTNFSLSNPTGFLSPRAIDRRARYNITIDSTDLPVSQAQLNQIASIPNLIVFNTSKWLNAISVQTTDATAIASLNTLPFVRSVSGLAARSALEPTRNKFEIPDDRPIDEPIYRTYADHYDYGTGAGVEIRLHQGQFLHNIGLRGQGMQIAMLDGGYYNYTGLKAFDSINTSGRVLSTWDFVSRNNLVSDDHPHGMQCLSTIAANIPGQFVGKAPMASFHLYRTEDVNSEYPIEEFNWVCGAEKADSIGADLISSSLGYYEFDNSIFNYSYSQMDGQTTLSAIGADMGARKGLLILNAAGNEGNNAWKYIITPADADSVVCVGAVNSNGIIGSFSSYGPSADGQIKPDVASVGVSAIIQGTGNTIVSANGTSFACPNMAGLATCLWQGFPEFNNMRIIRALRESGDRFGNPDDRTGYGIPNMKNAFGKLLVEFATSSVSANNCQASIQWNSKDVQAMRYEIERKLPGEATFSPIGTVLARTGTILRNQSYQFNHALPSMNAGSIQFRIRQIIDTAASGFTAVYLDTATLNLSQPCFRNGNTDPNITLKAFIAPNPSRQGITYLVMDSGQPIGNIQLEIVDDSGRRLNLLNLTKSSGRQTIALPKENLPAGTYLVRITRDDELLLALKWIQLR